MKEKEQRELMKIAWPRMAIIKKRKEKLQELADSLSIVLWNQIMTTGEKEIWEKYPEDFHTIERLIVTSDTVINKTSYPGLLNPIQELNNRNTCWMLYEGEFYNPSSIESKDIDLTKWKAKQFYISKPEYICNSSSSGEWKRCTERQRKIYWPTLNRINLRLDSDFLESYAIKRNSDSKEDKFINLEVTPEVEELKIKLIEFINLYRQEYSQRINLWKFLSTDGVSPAKCEKFWPELFDKDYEQSDS